MENSANLLGLPKYVDKTEVVRKSHTLDAGSTAVVFGGFLQLCDVSEPVIRMMIDAVKHHPQVYSVCAFLNSLGSIWLDSPGALYKNQSCN
jgi:hypothetical protein